MFDRSREESDVNNSVGGMIESIACRVVDGSTQVTNENEYPSTRHMSQCVGETCSADRDCHANAGGSLYCSQNRGNTCQLARYIPEKQRCQEDKQCREGYCSDKNGVKRCEPRRGNMAPCAFTSECASGLRCCQMAGGSRCTREACRVNEDITRCTNSGEACFTDASCCTGSCMLDPALVTGQCM